MKTKSLIILGVILAVVVGIIYLSENLDSLKGSGKVKEYFPGFSEANCSAFQITDKSGTIKIKKQGNNWVIESQEQKEVKKVEEGSSALEEAVKKDPAASDIFEYTADSASVASVMEKLAVMKMDELISKNPEKQNVFEVDSVNGVLVEVWDSKNKSIGKFRIGKSGPDWSSHYVRIIGSNDVHSVGGSIKFAFFAEEKRWRDKSVVKFDQFLAKKIKISKKDSPVIELEKTVDTSGAKWLLAAPVKSPTDSATVASMVKELSNLVTSNFEEDLSAPDSLTGLNDPFMVISIELDNGDKKKITVGNLTKEDNQRWVKAEGKRPTFLVYKNKFNNVDKSVEDLKEKKEEEK